MNWESRVPSTHERPFPWQQAFPLQGPSPICHSERSEESAVRLDPSPIPKGNPTANSTVPIPSQTPLMYTAFALYSTFYRSLVRRAASRV